MSAWGEAEGSPFGQALTDSKNSLEFRNERARLQRDLDAAQRAHAGASAQHDAAVCLLNTTIKELAEETAGTLQVRRFSDPANTKLRAEAFIATAEGQLKRLSDGTMEFAQGDLAVMKLVKSEVGEMLSHPRTTPKVSLYPPDPSRSTRKPKF